MRVAIFKDYMLNFSETFIIEQSNALSRHGIKVNLIAFMKLDNHISKDLAVIEYLPSRFKKISIIFSKITGIYEIIWLNKIKNHNFDVLHAHFGTSAFVIYKLARFLKIPLITTFHGYDILIDENKAKEVSINYSIYAKKRHTVFKSSHTIIAVSDFIRNELIKKGCPDNKIIVNYIGIDISKYDLYKNYEERDIDILFVGRLIEGKGIYDLIDAVNTNVIKNKKINLVIVGDGPEKNRIIEIMDRMGIKYNFPGSLPHSRVIELMSRAKILCVPSKKDSKGWREAFGMVFIEAQAVGTPVVSYISGGIPEAVENGETGMLVTEGSTQELASSISCLLEDKSFWCQLSKKAYERVRQKFDMHKKSAELVGIYEEVFNNSREIK